MVTVAAVAALAASLLCGVIGLQQAALARAERIAARTPVLLDGPSSGGSETTRGTAEAGTTRWATSIDTWRGRDIDRMLVGSDGTGTPPPGIARLPVPGETILSPALRTLAREEPTLRARLGDLSTGSITAEGLTEPDELLAYVGVEPDRLAADTPSVESFGSASQDPRGQGGVRLFVLLGVMTFVLAPASISVLLASRVGDAQRQRQLAALERLGLPSRLLIGTQAIRTAIPAACGAALGAVAHRWSVPLLGRGGLAGHRAFATDLAVSIPEMAAVAFGLASVTALLVACSLRRSGDIDARPRTVRVAGWRRLPAPTAPALGVLSLGIARASAFSIELRRLALDVSVLALLVGLPSLVRALAMWGGRALGRGTNQLSTLLAARRVEGDPGTVSRPAAVMALVIAAVVLANFQVTRFAGDMSVEGPPIVSIESAARPEPGRWDAMHAAVRAAGITTVLRVVELPDPYPARFVLASCGQLARIAEAGGLPRCTADPARLSSSGMPDPDPALVRLDASTTVALASHDIELSFPGASAFDAAIRVDPASALGRRLRARTTSLIVEAPPAAAAHEDLSTAVLEHDPMARVTVPDETGVASTIAYRANGEWFRIGSWLLALMAAPGLFLALLEVIGERRRQLAALAVVGIGRWTLVLSTALEVGTVLAVGVMVGAGCGAMVASVAHAQAHEGDPFAMASVAVTGGGLVLAMTIAVASAHRAGAVAKDSLPVLTDRS